MERYLDLKADPSELASFEKTPIGSDQRWSRKIPDPRGKITESLSGKIITDEGQSSQSVLKNRLYSGLGRIEGEAGLAWVEAYSCLPQFPPGEMATSSTSNLHGLAWADCGGDC